MKNNLIFLFSFLALDLLQAQGTFQNLDFEQANIVPLGGSDTNEVEASAALPGWTVYLGGSSVNYVLYDTVSLGSPAVSIQDSLSPVAQPLQGSYSVVLQHSGIDSTTAGIGQTGQLPQNAASITFYVANYQTLQLTFAGNSIPLVQLGTTANYSVYGGNIAPYAGQTGELLFTDIANNSQPMELDNIQFSSSVPEPSAFGLFALGSLFFGLRRWRKPWMT